MSTGVRVLLALFVFFVLNLIFSVLIGQIGYWLDAVLWGLGFLAGLTVMVMMVVKQLEGLAGWLVVSLTLCAEALYTVMFALGLSTDVWRITGGVISGAGLLVAISGYMYFRNRLSEFECTTKGPDSCP